MDLEFSPQEHAFRQKVRAFIDANLPAATRAKVMGDRPLEKEDIVGWQRILNTRGWATPSWPQEYGGPGWNAVQRYIFLDELHQGGAPEPLSFNVAMLGPVVIAYGTEEQKRTLLPRLANVDDWWCQGFSEPGAGSDLANLSTIARREGDHYVVNGQKIWQGMGHWADWGFFLVRTDPHAPKKQAGITFLLIDMTSPGVSLSPIITLDGRHEVNSVFLDDVRVPVGNRIGEENQGWTVAKYLLTNERTNIARVGVTKRILARTRRAAAATGLIDTPLFAARLARIEVALQAVETLQLRVLAAQIKENKADSRASVLKLRSVEVRQAASELLMEACGAQGLSFVRFEAGERPPFDEADEGWSASAVCFNLRAASIYGGASEVQRNILADAVLGLGRG
ncbi:MAG: acyl-CoA dehydrogenase family protein [Hyphomonadaceae bacterium]